MRHEVDQDNRRQEFLLKSCLDHQIQMRSSVELRLVNRNTRCLRDFQVPGQMMPHPLVELAS